MNILSIVVCPSYKESLKSSFLRSLLQVDRITCAVLAPSLESSGSMSAGSRAPAEYLPQAGLRIESAHHFFSLLPH